MLTSYTFYLDHPVEDNNVCGVRLGEEGVALLAGDARRVEEALVLKFDQKWSHWILSGKAADFTFCLPVANRGG